MTDTKLQVTRPKSPRLRTNMRHRPLTDYKAPEERELEEIEQLKAAIKARKENAKRLLENVKRSNGSRQSLALQMPRTVPQSPNLETAKRATLHEISDRGNAQNEGAKDVKKREKISDPLTPDDHQLERMRRTVPKTPKLATRARAAARPPLFPSTPTPPRQDKESPPLGRTIPKTPNLSFRSVRENRSHSGEEGASQPFRARPAPDFSRQHARHGQKQRESFSRTVPEPFKLSTSNKAATPPTLGKPRASFKARLMPNFEEINQKCSARGDWSANRRKGTIPDPFQLRSEILHENALRKIEEAERAREASEKEKRIFKARPLDEDMLQGPLFLPTLNHEHTVVTDGTEMHSEQRALERAKYEEERRKREEEEKERREIVERERQREEERKLQEERKANAFKARLLPLSHFHPDMPDTQVRPGTSPHTPALRTMARAKSFKERYSYIYEKKQSEGGASEPGSESTLL